MASELVPVFMPPLATVLAAAERQAGRALSEQEVVAIRDRSVAMMMKPADAERMSESRGFRDVDPEDCWADWHRLGVEHTGNGYLPKLVLTFAAYLLTACPPQRFASGHTFRCDAESARYVVRWEPCTGYDEDDFFFNPFGRYRFERA